MSSSGDSTTPPWRVRFGGGTYRVKDEQSLRKLVETGKVPPDAEVQLPDAVDWLPLARALGDEQEPLLEPESRDPWAVWESLDDDAELSVPPPSERAPPVGAEPPPVARPRAPAQPPSTTPPRSAEPPVPERPPSSEPRWRPRSAVLDETPASDDFSLAVTPAQDEPADHDEDIEEVATVDSHPPLSLGDRATEAAPAPPSTRQPQQSSPPSAASHPGRTEPRSPHPRSPDPRSPDPRSPDPRSPDPAGLAPAQPRAPGAGNVIYFPGTRGGRRDTEGPHALAASETLPFPQPDSPSMPSMELGPSPRTHSARAKPQRVARGDRTAPNWWRIGAIFLSGLVILGAVRWYVAMNSTADFGAPSLSATTVAAPPGASPVVTPSQPDPASAGTMTEADLLTEPVDADPYRELEQDLRGQLRSGLLPVESAGDLETALLIELNNVRLDVITIDINVLGTAGDSEIPESVEVRLRLRDPDSDLARQLGAAALVVGKYAQHFDLAVPLFEVGFPAGDDKIKRVRIGIDSARALFLGRLSLRDFLAELIAH